MEPDAFLALAGELATRDDPAALRTATSRAYYAVFHVCCDSLRSADIVLPSDEDARRPGDDHPFIVRCLRRSGDSELRRASEQLEVLRADRTTADYILGHRMIGEPDRALGNVRLAERLARQIRAAFERTDDHRRERRRISIQRTLRQLQRDNRL